MRRLLLIAAWALLTAIAGHAASNIVVVDGVTYEWSPRDLSYIAIGWDEQTPLYSLHIRAEVEGLDVVGVAVGAFEDNLDITSLTIDEGILYIGQNAFARCTGLQVVILPEGLVTIEEEAFAYCTALTMMSIPSTVQDIQAHAFMGCTGVTDVYFLMDDAQLDDFAWWDGVYPSPGEEQHGGMEFNESRLPGHNPEGGTRIHVPNGLFEDYRDSGKFEAWLLEEDSGIYPLWWIVNYGVVGRSYTVADQLTAVYTDVDYNLYVKDDNHWLTPDRRYAGEVDYMRMTGLMSHKDNTYDQSNWAVLTELMDPVSCNGHTIQAATITGTLLDKRNPVIEVTQAPVRGDEASYVPNVYVPCSFMGRTQMGILNEATTFAFVQPKPQEYMRVEWMVYHDTNEGNEFYAPEPDPEQGVNRAGLSGGFLADYSLYERPPVPTLDEGGYYAFPAINRLSVEQDWRHQAPRRAVEPWVSGGLSTTFTVYPLSLPDEPIITGIETLNADTPATAAGWYTLDGRYLGTRRPTVPGIYLHNGSVFFRY